MKLTDPQRDRITSAPLSELDMFESRIRKSWDSLTVTHRSGHTIAVYERQWNANGNNVYQVYDGIYDKERVFFDAPLDKRAGTVRRRRYPGFEGYQSYLSDGRILDGFRDAQTALNALIETEAAK